MTHKITLIFILIFVTKCSCQNNIQLQYENQNKADSFLFLQKDTIKALNYYTKLLFDSKLNINIVSNDYWINAIKLSACKKRFDLTDSLFRQFIKCGLHKELYCFYKDNDTNLTGYLKSNLRIKLEEDFDELYKIYHKKIDVDLSNQLSQLYGQDQITRNISDIPKLANISNTILRDSILKFIIDYSDCDIKLQLLNILTNYKFNSEVCYKNPIGVLSFLMLHNLRNFNTKSFDTSCMNDLVYFNTVQPALLILVKEGYMQNNAYAYLIDRANCWNNFNGESLQVYGTHLTNYKNKKYLMYPISDIENVDKRRAEIFLPTLYQASIIDGFELPINYKFKK